MQYQENVKSTKIVNSVNISLLKTTFAQEYVQLDILTKIQYVLLDVFQDSKIMDLEVVSP
jgi:hypothetical protein